MQAGLGFRVSLLPVRGRCVICQTPAILEIRFKWFAANSMCSDSGTIRPKCVQDLFFTGSKDKSSGHYSSAGLGLGITEPVDVPGLLLKGPGHCREHAKQVGFGQALHNADGSRCPSFGCPIHGLDSAQGV